MPVQHIYVWQQAWSAAVSQQLAVHGNEFAQLDILVAELNGLVGRSTQPAVDWNAVRSTGRPIGLVVRIGDYRGSTSAEAPATRRLIAVCQAALAQARGAQITVAELQLDYDCPSSRLSAYQVWLEAIRREVRPPELVITALPDWLHQAAFPRLASAADQYVLQVHSVEPPRAGVSATLCDPIRAASWIAQAERLGRPFRVALPNYGYRLGIGPSDRLIGVQAEGADRPWPAGTRVSNLMADPVGIARLVAELSHNPPPHLTAVSWFRLPLPADDLTWPWVTFAAVRRGIVPRGQGRLQLAPAPNGAIDLIVTNPGDGAWGAETIVTEPTPNRVLAWDTVPGWQGQPQPGGRLALTPESSGDLVPAPLAPGEQRRIGWLRYAPPRLP